MLASHPCAPTRQVLSVLCFETAESRKSAQMKVSAGIDTKTFKKKNKSSGRAAHSAISQNGHWDIENVDLEQVGQDVWNLNAFLVDLKQRIGGSSSDTP